MTSNIQFQSPQSWLSLLCTIFFGKKIILKTTSFNQLPPLRGQPRDLSPHCLTALQRHAHPQLAGLSPPTQAQRVQNSSPSSFPDLQTPLTSPCSRLLPRSNPPVSPPESRSLHPHGLCPCLANVHQVTKSHQIRPLPPIWGGLAVPQDYSKSLRSDSSHFSPVKGHRNHLQGL